MDAALAVVPLAQNASKPQKDRHLIKNLVPSRWTLKIALAAEPSVPTAPPPI